MFNALPFAIYSSSQASQLLATERHPKRYWFTYQKSAHKGKSSLLSPSSWSIGYAKLQCCVLISDIPSVSEWDRSYLLKWLCMKEAGDSQEKMWLRASSRKLASRHATIVVGSSTTGLVMRAVVDRGEIVLTVVVAVLNDLHRVATSVFLFDFVTHLCVGWRPWFCSEFFWLREMRFAGVLAKDVLGRSRTDMRESYGDCKPLWEWMAYFKDGCKVCEDSFAERSCVGKEDIRLE